MNRESKIGNADKTVGIVMKRPVSLTVVAVLLFFVGLSGIVADCVRIHGLELAPSANLFNMIAGIGLLKCWRGARWYALFVFGSFLLVALPMIVWAVFNSNRMVFQFPSVLIDDRLHAISPLFLVVLVMTGYAAISAWMVWVLLQGDVRELFERNTNSSTASVSV